MASKTIATILNLKDNFSDVIKKTTQNTKGFQNQVSKTQSSIKDFKSGVTSSFKSAAGSVVGFAASYIGIKAVYGYLKQGIELAKNSEAGVAQLGAVLKSTNNAVGISKQGLLDLAASYGTYTTYTKGAVLTGENLLLTFTNIGKDVFPQVTTTMLDMSTALKQDVSASAMQLGKALNNPISGLTALKRVGVSFTDSQVKQITAMQKAGNIVGAQKIILQELNKEFGGSAKAVGQTLPNQIIILQNQFNALKKAIGEKFIPILYSVMQFAVSKMPMIKLFFTKAFDEIGKIINIVVDIFKTKLIPIASDVLNRIRKFVDDNKQAFLGFIDSVKNLVLTIITDLKPTIMEIVNSVLPSLKDGFSGNTSVIKDILTAAKDTFNFISKNWKEIKPIIQGIILAMAAWKLAIIAVTLWSGIVTFVTSAWGTIDLIIWGIKNATSAWEAAQWLLNVAMESNPIGLVVAVIAVLGVAIFEIITHLDTIKKVASEVWVSVKNAFITGVNGCIDMINKLIDLIDKIPGINIKRIGKLQYDTSLDAKKSKTGNTDDDVLLSRPRVNGSHANGLKKVPYDGYIAEVHKDEAIIPASENPYNKSNNKSSKDGIKVYVIIQGNVIGNEEFADEVGNHVVSKVVSALNNM